VIVKSNGEVFADIGAKKNVIPAKAGMTFF
jgi:hypothetical protein